MVPAVFSVIYCILGLYKTDNGHFKIPNGQLKNAFVLKQNAFDDNVSTFKLYRNYNLIFITVTAFYNQVSLFTIIKLFI